jgi:hypothetical protein
MTHQRNTTKHTSATIMDIMSMRLSGDLRIHHQAACQGYVSRKSAGRVLEYRGRFGVGYVIDTPRRDTTRYIHRTYYVQPKQA